MSLINDNKQVVISIYLFELDCSSFYQQLSWNETHDIPQLCVLQLFHWFWNNYVPESICSHASLSYSWPQTPVSACSQTWCAGNWERHSQRAPLLPVGKEHFLLDLKRVWPLTLANLSWGDRAGRPGHIAGGHAWSPLESVSLFHFQGQTGRNDWTTRQHFIRCKQTTGRNEPWMLFIPWCVTLIRANRSPVTIHRFDPIQTSWWSKPFLWTF